MLTYQKIVQSGVMTPSIASLLLTESPDVQAELLSSKMWDGPLTRFCMFYRALVQAYVIGLAIHRDCTVDELKCSPRLRRAVRTFWPNEDDKTASTRENESEVFSFLFDAEEFLDANGRQILNSLHLKLKERKTPGNRDSFVMNEQRYMTLFSSFYLLARAEVDLAQMKFSFPVDPADMNSERFTVHCAPFIYCVQQHARGETVVESFTNEGMALVSVKRGEKNGDLLFGFVELHTAKTTKALNYRTVRRHVPRDENLYQICRALGMDTDWYEMDDYLCNMAFLVRITEMTKSVLLDFWRHKQDIPILNTPSADVKRKLLHMLQDDLDMCRSIDQRATVNKTNFERVLYGLYIEFGVFKTMRALLMDSPAHTYGDDLFDEYMSRFVKMEKDGKGGITQETRESYERECERIIHERLEKLAGIVPPDHPRYRKRERAISAEWRAYYILKAAGIHADNLFADEETILSIDDYFSMIKNPTATLKSDLNDVLSFLIEMYGALMVSGADFDETTFRQEVLRIRQQNYLLDTLELFDALEHLVQDSQGHDAIQKALGRDSICDVEKLNGFISNIKYFFDTEQEFRPAQIVTKKWVVVSYARQDYERVNPYVVQWQKQGFHVVMDKNRLQGGDNWWSELQKAIADEDCAAVMYFVSPNSMVSSAVCRELLFCLDESINRKIVPINLEKENVEAYARRIINDMSVYTKEQKAATGKILEKVLALGDDHYLTTEEAIEAELKRLLILDHEEGFYEQRSYNNFELAVANFYALLKFGNGNFHDGSEFDWKEGDKIDAVFHSDVYEVSRCIYPLIASVKETKIKRDNIALMGYEILRDKGEDKRGTHYIFSSKRLTPDDYYCIPNYRTTGEDGIWMVNPLMINHHLFRPEEQQEE